MRVQNYAYLKDFPFQDVKRLWRYGQLCEKWWEYYCWEWRNSAPRFSNICQEWEGKPAPGPKPVDGTNYDPDDLCCYCGEYIKPSEKVIDRGDPFYFVCQLCRDYDESEGSYA